MVAWTKSKSAKEIHFVVGKIPVAKRTSSMVQELERRRYEMTREEAIQVLQTALTSPFIYGKYAEAIDMAIEALQAKTGEWIPTSERLPEDKTYVLTTIHVNGRQPHARSGFYHGGFFHNDNGDTWKATDRPLKAWMPLPEPYKGGDLE
jgi:hypothetical protein